MGKIRVHELAKEFGIDNKEALRILIAAGIEAKSHSSSVYEDEARAALKKVLSPGAAAVTPAEAPKKARPGMMIVKKKDVAAEPTEAALAPSPSVEAQPPEPLPPAVEQEEEEPALEPQAEEPVAEEPVEEPARLQEPEPVQAQRREAASEERQRDVASPPQAATPSQQRAAPEKPGGAKVVRMIDREKLLERVPSGRLGGNRGGGDRGGPGGPPGRSFGQVTELKVVTDPFGRGREMVAIGKDKKGGKRAGTTGVGADAGKRPRPVGKRGMGEQRERAMMPSRLKKKKPAKLGMKKPEETQKKASKRVIHMKETLPLSELAHQLGVKVTELIRKIMGMGSMVTANENVDLETAQLLAADYEYTVESIAFDEEEHIAEVTVDESPENMVARPPVVTIMGHVDHGKTSLLDAIRKAKVAEGEAGGITQHIGAYQVDVKGKGTITFLDTPGHAAFTNMRARGAQVTDIVVLVVAADDGVMPQTVEAIQHAQAAEVPIIVAVNKIDRPNAQPDRVMQELTKHNLLSEQWGGETLYVQTSATKGTGIDQLLETILLQAEVLDLKANEKTSAVGVVVEAKLDKGRGPVATVLVQHGILRQGDSIVTGEFAGKVRAMTDATGKQLKDAKPSMAVEIIGLEGVPNAGDKLQKAESAEGAREIAQHRVEQRKAAEQQAPQRMSLEDMLQRMSGEETTKELKLVIKADVQGSVEAIKGAVAGLSTSEVKVSVLAGGVGGVKESDIMLAATSRAVIVGFNVRPDGQARSLAEREGVEIRTYSIIYELLDDVKKAMEGLLKPVAKETIIGRAEVRELFKIAKVGTIAGCRVTEGKAQRSARARILRDSVQVWEGRLASLKHFKNDVREVEAGNECGLSLDGFNDIKQGDVVEFFSVEEVARTLDAPPAGGGKRSAGGEAAQPRA